MPSKTLDEKSGLTTALLFVEDYALDGWGWWCPECSTRDRLVQQDGFATRDGARREAKRHEKRRGHR